MPVDVIIVTYNSALWVDRVLPTLGDVHTVVVDNASADETVELLRRHRAEVIANDENRYLSPAWAQGLSHCSAPIVVLMNPDCEIRTAGWAGKLEAFFSEHPDVGIVGPRLLDEDGAVQYTGHPFRSKRWALGQVLLVPALLGRLGRPPDYRWEPGWLRDTLRDVDVVSGAFLALRRQVLEEIGGIDTAFRLYWEEDDLCRRARDAGYRVVLYPDIEVMHAWAQSIRQVGVEVLTPIMRYSFDRYFAKHHGRPFAALLRALRRCTDGARRFL